MSTSTRTRANQLCTLYSRFICNVSTPNKLPTLLKPPYPQNLGCNGGNCAHIEMIVTLTLASTKRTHFFHYHRLLIKTVNISLQTSFLSTTIQNCTTKNGQITRCGVLFFLCEERNVYKRFNNLIRPLASFSHT